MNGWSATTRRVLVDLALTAAALAYGVVVQPQVVPATPLHRIGLLEAGVALLALSGLWWLRRRSPVGFAVLAVVSTFLCDVTGALPPIALATIGLRGAWLPTVVATVAMSCAILAQLRLQPGPEPMRAAFGTVVIFTAVAGWATAVHHRRQVVALLRRQVEEAAAAAERRADDARRAERARIARDMHDTLAHRMSLLALHGAALAQRSAAADEEVREIARLVRTTARESLEDLRWMLGALHATGEDEPLRPAPGPADLQHLVEQARTLGTVVTLETVPSAAALDALPAPIGHVLFRVVQEALTNSRKHGAGRPVAVRIVARPGSGVEVAVTESGPPAGAAARAGALPGSGRGLVGLAERVRAVGGSLEHGPVPRSGFRVCARLPWTPHAAEAPEEAVTR